MIHKALLARDILAWNIVNARDLCSPWYWQLAGFIVVFVAGCIFWTMLLERYMRYYSPFSSYPGPSNYIFLLGIIIMIGTYLVGPWATASFGLSLLASGIAEQADEGIGVFIVLYWISSFLDGAFHWPLVFWGINVFTIFFYWEKMAPRIATLVVCTFFTLTLK